MRQLAPSGTPITIKELSVWLKTIPFQGATLQQFEKEICSYFGVKYCFFLSTGRAAMALLLQTMSQLSETSRDTIIIPSYTCFSVPSSIIKAGLKIKICDVNPYTLDFDYEKLSKIDFSKVLGIVSSNLYGIPNDLDLLEEIAKEKGCFCIDDAAQCMGGKSATGRFAGTFGDAGIFSLDKGKVITSMNGGIIVTNSPHIASIIRSKIGGLNSPSLCWRASELIKLLIYSFFLNPNLYWLPASLPFLKLGITVYTTDYPIEKYNKMLAGIALQLFQRFNEINTMRIENSRYYMDNLPETKWLRHVPVKSGVVPVYLRFPVLLQDKQKREQVVRTLVDNRLGATKSFPSSIADLHQLRDKIAAGVIDASGGKTVAEQIVTLPTHPYVTKSDQDRIVSLLLN